MANAWNHIGRAQHAFRPGIRLAMLSHKQGRGKYWEPNSERQKKDEQKRERRRQRNIKQAFTQKNGPL